MEYKNALRIERASSTLITLGRDLNPLGLIDEWIRIVLHFSN